MRLLGLLLFFSTISADTPYPVSPGENIFLLSYESSGSHWFMQNIQFMTREVWHAPSRDILYFNNLVDTNRLFRGHECDSKYIFFGNYRRFPHNKEKDFLILLLRDYRQIACRYIKSGNELIENYFRLIDFYDMWPNERKKIIYYEDLLISPGITFTALAPIFGYPTSEVEHLISSDTFELVPPKNHCANFSNDQLIEIDYRFQQHCPEHYEKYLSRYSDG